MNAKLFRFALLTTVCTCLLLLAGALVTSKEAGDSVPDWPLSYGRLIPPLVGNIVFEWGHRVIAGVVLLLTLGLAIWIQRTDARMWMRRLGWLAFAAVFAQALLGGLRVLNPGIAKPIAVFHAALAQSFFCLLVSVCVFTSRAWYSMGPPQEDSGGPRMRTLAVWSVAVVYLQLLLGAVSRHFKFVVNPHLIVAPHVLNAFVVLTLSILVGIASKQRFAHVAAIRKPASLFSAFAGTQIILGLLTYWTVLVNRTEPAPWTPMVWATVAHLVLGALTMACTVVLALFAFRATIPAPETVRAIEEERAVS